MKSSSSITLVVILAASSVGCSKIVSLSVCLPTSDAISTRDISGGKFSFGENRFYANEKPILVTEVGDFNIDLTEVTNRQFNAFVEATGYITDAELGLSEKEFPDLPQNFVCRDLWFLSHLIQTKIVLLLGGILCKVLTGVILKGRIALLRARIFSCCASDL